MDARSPEILHAGADSHHNNYYNYDGKDYVEIYVKDNQKDNEEIKNARFHRVFGYWAAALQSVEILQGGSLLLCGAPHRRARMGAVPTFLPSAARCLLPVP